MSEKIGQTNFEKFVIIPGLNAIGSLFSRKKTRHDFTIQNLETDYVFETFNQGKQVYLTSHIKNIACGNYVILRNDGVLAQYEVEEIDHYASPSYMWIARLVKSNDLQL
jgi:hypothetical protein